MENEMSLLTRLKLACFLSIFASQPVFGQRWEAGAGASALFLTDGDLAANAPEVFVRRHQSPRLALTLTLNTLSARQEDASMLILASQWYNRTRHHAEISARYAFLTDRRQDLGVAVGVSAGYRDEVRFREAYYPAYFAGQSEGADRLVEICSATPACVFRRYDIETTSGLGDGPFVGIGTHRTSVVAGPSLELEYGVRLGPVRAAAHAGARLYVAGPPKADLTWQTGLRIGTRF